MQLFSIGLVERNPDFRAGAGRGRATGPHLQLGGGGGDGAGVHRLDPVGQSDANYGRVGRAAMRRCKATRPSMTTQAEDDLPRHRDQQRQRLRRRPGAGAGCAEQPSQHRALHQPPADPALRHQQPEPGLHPAGGPGMDRQQRRPRARAARSCSTARRAPRRPTRPYGKPREPLLRIAHLWRAYQAKYVPPADGSQASRRRQNTGDLTVSIGDSQRAPSVFNFFEPDLPRSDGQRQPGRVRPRVADRQRIDLHHRPQPERRAVVELRHDRGADRQHQCAGAGHHPPGAARRRGRPRRDGAGREPAAVRRRAVAGQRRHHDRMLELAQPGRSSSERARSLLLLALSSPDYAIQR